MSDLAHTLETAAQAERRTARRRLLAAPLLGRDDDPDAYAAVLRHRDALVAWFAEHTGWHLVVDESGGFARLHKTAAHPDATRPATAGRARRPFTRRRYTLLCLALAALDDRRSQTTLQRLAEAVTAASLEQETIDAYDATRQAERRALVDALKLLAELGVLRERDGDADRYADSHQGDVLYDIDDRRIAQLVSAPSSPSLVDRPEDLPVEAYPDTEDGAKLRARHQVMRRLLDDPVVYYDDLDERQHEWLTHSLGFVRERLEADVGLTVERRAEGLAAVDPDKELADETFPDGASTVKHAALLLAELLTDRATAARDAGEDIPVVADAVLHDWTARLAADVGTRCGWRAAYTDGPNGAQELAGDALALLVRFGLVRRAPGGWQPRPALARFAPAAPPASPQAVLFPATQEPS